MLALVLALLHALAAPPTTSAYLSIGTSELAYDGQDATTATASIYSTTPQTVTVALDTLPLLVYDRAPRQVFVAPERPATLTWRLALDQENAAPSRTPFAVRLMVNGAPRAAVSVRAWVNGVVVPRLWYVWLPVVK